MTVIYRKIVNYSDAEKLQIDLGRLAGVGSGKWDENKSR
jgi:hypothetical protein